MTTQHTPPDIVQADREVAAAIYEMLGFGSGQHIIDGFEDDLGVVSAIAQHRITSAAQMASLIEAQTVEIAATMEEIAHLRSDLDGLVTAGQFLVERLNELGWHGDPAVQGFSAAIAKATGGKVMAKLDPAIRVAPAIALARWGGDDWLETGAPVEILAVDEAGRHSPLGYTGVFATVACWVRHWPDADHMPVYRSCELTELECDDAALDAIMTAINKAAGQ